MLAVLARAQQQSAVPPNVNFTANVSTTHASRNRRSVRAQRQQVIEFHRISKLQPILFKRPQISAALIWQYDVPDLEYGFGLATMPRKANGAVPNLRILAAFPLFLERCRIQAVDRENNTVYVPLTNLLGREMLKQCSVGVEKGLHLPAPQSGHHLRKLRVQNRLAQAANL